MGGTNIIFEKKKSLQTQLGSLQFVGSMNLLGIITDMNLNTFD